MCKPFPTIKRRAVALLGHIVRLPDEDPMKQVTVRGNKPLHPAAKRVGRPKLNWTKEKLAHAGETAEKNNPATPGNTFKATEEQYDNLTHPAEMRRLPFDTKKPRSSRSARFFDDEGSNVRYARYGDVFVGTLYKGDKRVEVRAPVLASVCETLDGHYVVWTASKLE